MAAELDITAGAYAKIERGETDPSATRLVKIAAILEVDVTSFFKDNPSGRAEDTGNPYGYATKLELENLAMQLRQLSREIEQLKARKK